MEATRDTDRDLIRLLEARATDVHMLVSVQRLAAHLEVSPKTIRRRRERYSLPWRDIHGDRWSEGDGPKRLSVAEWHAKEPMPTRKVKRLIQ